MAEALFGDLVHPFARFVFRGFDLDPMLLAPVEMKPRTLWACHSAAFMISGKVAPLVRPIISRILAPLLSPRGALAFFSTVGLPALFAALGAFAAAFLVAAAFGLALFAPFWPLGAPFFRLAPFVEEAFSGASCAPCAATVAAVSVVSALLMLVFLSALRLRMTIHRSGGQEKQAKSD
jgi:hypothetical protein